MTLDNLQYTLYLNNCILLDKIKTIKDAINGIKSTDIDELKKLLDNINNTELINIKQLIADLDTNLSNHTSDTVIHVTQDDKDLWNATLQNAKDYAKKLFDGVTSFTIEIVDTLPTEDIQTMTIYFMRNGRDNESDYYEEYMYINNKWEIIGSTFVNLAPYVLKEDFEKYQQEITDKFAKYNTSNEIANILKDYLLTQTFIDTLKNYSTTSEINKLLEAYAKKTELHKHDNKDILDKLSESSNGNLLFDGQEIKGGSDIIISKEENNAIQQKDDGIFVENKTEQINNIQTRVNQISIAQKTVNTELDSCFCQLKQSYTPISGEYVPFEKTSGSFEVNNGRIIIKPGQRIQINLVLNYFNNAGIISNILYYIKDYTNNINIKAIQPVNTNVYEYAYTQCCQYTNDTNKNCEIGLYVEAVYNSDTLEFTYTSMTIQEISRQIVIDPVEYINTEQGIEDTPIGHIISHMGNNAPKHYLICDGTEYNITDYPYLAQHFMDEFGSYNYFGGDGLSTFAVPDLRGEFLRGTGENSNQNSGNGANVGEHQNPTYNTRMVTDAANRLCIDTVGRDAYTVFYMNEDSVINTDGRGLRYNPSVNDGNTSSLLYSMRPTNTSVLYCIKYEPTYFMTTMQTVSLEEAEAIKKQNTLLQEQINSLNTIIDSINRAVI